MAYGVKYRLEFDDDNSKGKKIEISKDSYTGSVLPIISTGTPVTISWNNNDDFYNPIIGSTCAINLYCTDTVTYDDFYTADEREYKIKISYKDASNNYQTYWEGWLLVDQFSESVISKPFPITLKGYDGLGSLNGFTAPIDLTSVGSKDLMFYITNILNNINLGLDIYISNDIQLSGAAGSDFTFYDQVSVSPGVFLKSGVDLRTAKNVLEQILKFSNARIFQSFGRWYIINNSSYSEQSVKDSSATTANSGTVPTGIRAAETTSLQNNGTESIKYFIYNSSGVYQSTSTVDVLQSVPTNLQPINADLQREFLRPLKEFSIEHVMDGRFSTNQISNPGFEHGSTNWTLTNSTIVTDFMFQGDRSLKSTTVQSTANATTVVAVNTNGSDQTSSSHIAYNLKFNVFFDSTSGNDRGFRYQIKLVGQGPGAGADQFWSDNSDNWVGADTKNNVDVITNKRWKSYSFPIKTLPSGSWLVFINIYGAFQTTTTSGFIAIYYDSIIFESEYIDDNNNRTPIFEKFDLLTNQRKRTADISGVKVEKDIYLTNKLYSNVVGSFFRSRDKTNFLKSVEEILTQQVMNDFRDFVVRYEGSLYNNSNDPIGPHNKLWVNFTTSVLQEPVSCIIDSMDYDVKRNCFKVVMHLPNQNDDITNDFITKF